MQGIGFSKRVSAAEKAAHIRAIRAEGFPDYDIKPFGQRDEYTAVVYLAPFDWRNRRAFGFDMFAEPVRRAAMERARDGAAAALSGKVTLIEETAKDSQAGFLLYLPLYRKGAAVQSVAERRAALAGYIYAAFGMNDFMRGILSVKNGDEVALEIFDGAETNPANRMYASDPALSSARHSA